MNDRMRWYKQLSLCEHSATISSSIVYFHSGTSVASWKANKKVKKAGHEKQIISKKHGEIDEHLRTFYLCNNNNHFTYEDIQ